MKIKTLFAWIIGIVTAVMAIRTGQGYRRWKVQQVERLRSESQLLVTERGTVEYQMEGDGPVVMLLHGSPGGYDHAIALARYLDLQGFSALALSRPGYRRTPLSSGETPEAQADLFAATLDTLNVSQAVVVALSGGGPAALQFALRYPDRCRGLIMLAALSQSYTEEAIYRSLPLGQSLLKRLFDQLVGFDLVTYLLVSLINLSPQGARSSGLIAALVMNNARTAGYKNDMRQFAELPAYPVEEIATPTLIVHGTADIDVPFSQAKQLVQKIPHAQLLAVEGADHTFVLSGEKTVEAIRNFLRSL
ncbi:MAG TPA: alpha/beta hydrolase [Ktedonosporobacter sp.]|nr:alpha/beta hydrolase [Ktedonosporobacter sp.]